MDNFKILHLLYGYDESPGHTHSLSIESVKPDDLGMWTITTEQENTATLKTSGMGSYGEAANIDTCTADHLFETGDIITYEQGPAATSIPVPGLVDGKSYKVTVVDSEFIYSYHILMDQRLNMAQFQILVHHQMLNFIYKVSLMHQQ